MSKKHISKKCRILQTEIKQPIISSSTYFPKNKPCHEITEIYPKLYIGNLHQVKSMIQDIGVDVLVPLDSLEGSIWDWGFTGEIYYFPVNDYEILPTDILDRVVGKILDCIIEHKITGLFCLGGHGRTGYIAACVLGLLGIEDPIEYLRTNYCSKAIETNEQLRHISKYLKKPDLYEKYKIVEKDIWYGYGYGYEYGYGSNESFDYYGDYLKQNNQNFNALDYYEKLWGKNKK